VDGPTCHKEPFVGSGLESEAGWQFWFTPMVSLVLCVDAAPLVPRPNPEGFVLADCWNIEASANDIFGWFRGAFLDAHSFTTTLELESGAAGLLVGPDQALMTDETRVIPCANAWFAVTASCNGSAGRFSAAVSYASEEDAVSRAHSAQAADLEAAISARRVFVESARPPDNLVDSTLRAYYRSASVHKVNIESAQGDIPCRWTTPDRMPHRHMWMWDSAFHSLGLCRIDPNLGEDCIRALLAKQRSDGKLSLAAQPDLPPPDNDDSQPPIVAWAVARQYEAAERLSFVNEVYPALVRYVEWFEANRKDDTGLYGWRVRGEDDSVKAARGGESGMDNSPRFDNVTSITAADLSSYMVAEYEALERFATELWKMDEAAEWKARKQHVAALIDELLWDDEDRFYYDLDEDGDFVPVKTTAGFMPLFAGIPDSDRAEALRMHLTNAKEFWTPLPVPSVSMDEPSFSSDMWRGPVWMNMNVLIYHGLKRYQFYQEARSLARKSMQEIVRCYNLYGSFYEYYDALMKTPPAKLPRKGGVGNAGGVGFGVVPDLQWTAASYIHFAHQTAFGA
jgi:glycogen debranching enzyme